MVTVSAVSEPSPLAGHSVDSVTASVMRPSFCTGLVTRATLGVNGLPSIEPVTLGAGWKTAGAAASSTGAGFEGFEGAAADVVCGDAASSALSSLASFAADPFSSEDVSSLEL